MAVVVWSQGMAMRVCVYLCVRRFVCWCLCGYAGVRVRAGVGCVRGVWAGLEGDLYVGMQGADCGACTLEGAWLRKLGCELQASPGSNDKLVIQGRGWL